MRILAGHKLGGHKRPADCGTALQGLVWQVVVPPPPLALSLGSSGEHLVDPGQLSRPVSVLAEDVPKSWLVCPVGAVERGADAGPDLGAEECDSAQKGGVAHAADVHLQDLPVLAKGRPGHIQDWQELVVGLQGAGTLARGDPHVRRAEQRRHLLRALGEQSGDGGRGHARSVARFR